MRAHWEAIADALLAGVQRFATPRRALLHLPGGRPSMHGRVSDGLEGYARSFLLAAFRLRGAGGVELVATARGEGEGPDFATVSGKDLLVEQESAEIHVAGETALHQGDRRIAAARLALVVDEDGAWSRVLAQGAVRFQQPGAQATGERLEYEMASGELLLLGTRAVPATFVYDELEYRSAEALRVRWEGEDVIIEATESGRTITKVVRASETEGSA